MSQLNRDAFAILTDAWQQGRPIVPLFGAGLSAGTGIPLTAQMIDYLAKVQWYVSHVHRTDWLEPYKTAAYLLKTGWPNLHDLNAEILRTAPAGPTGRGRPDVVAAVLGRMKIADDPNRWLVLLQTLCDGNQELKDLFFAGLEHGRHTATSHRLTAFLCGLMGWKLILTTNFDSLLEQALRSQSLDPTIYELAENGQVPDPQLVRSHFALVKLHGGTFGRLMSERLYYSLRRTDREHLLAFFPPNPLLLVLGYSGGDRRVMSLIEDFLLTTDPRLFPASKRIEDLPRVLWIHRNGKPASVESIEQDLGGKGNRIAAQQFRNGARFLQELYLRTATAHPASATYYRAFPHMAPRSAVPVPTAFPIADEPMVVFHAARAGAGTSTALAEAVQKLPHEVIWCDLEALATVDGLMTYLHNRLRRFDPGLPPFAFLVTGDHSLSALAPGRDVRVSYIVQAMRRGKYVVAIDSLGEFGTSHFSYGGDQDPNSVELTQVANESRRLRHLLRQLAVRRHEFGESRLFVAHTFLTTGDGPTDKAARAEGAKFLRALKALGVSVLRPTPRTFFASFRAELRRRFTGLARSNSTGQTLQKLIRAVWAGLADKDPRKWALALVACFRRRRDLVVMRRLLFPLICHGRSEDVANFGAVLGTAQRLCPSGWDRGIGHKEAQEIDDFLAGLHPLLIRQEGGFYWMHRCARDEIYHRVRKEYGSEALADLHDVLAVYYYTDLFRPSSDAAALFEYVFQRLLSLRCAEPKKRAQRLHDLAVVLSRERDHLLREAHAGWLRRCIARCRGAALEGGEVDETDPRLADVRDDLRRVLCELEAEACRQASLFEECIAVRADHLLYRVAQVVGGGGATPSEALRPLTEKLTTGGLMAVLATLIRQLTPELEREPEKAVVAFRHFFRLFDHLIDIAACRTGMGDEKKARQMLMPIRWFCRAALGDGQTEAELFQSAAEGFPALEGEAQLTAEMKQVHDALSAFQKCPRKIWRQLYDVRVRCAFRLMEAYLATVSPWASENRRYFLARAEGEFREGEQILRRYAGWKDRQFEKYLCFLSTLRARASYLQRHFALGYQFLDAARAAIRRPLKGSDFSALAVVLLHQAECLVLHANAELSEGLDRRSAADGAEENRAADGGERRMALLPAKVKLDRARQALAQAHAFLERGRLQAWAWAWLRVLQAQLEHEIIVWAMESQKHDAGPRTDGTDVVRKGLAYVRLGLDSCGQNLHRQKELDVLWWQFFTCFATLRREQTLGANQVFEEWERLNEAVELQGYCKLRAERFDEVWADIPDSPDRSVVLKAEEGLLRRGGMPLSH